ncbi:hypothetical protein Goari_008820 [Gossypium aridum]|uniref:Aminopeptidase n=1 Tax=Gossypium aridum TaxID=34290 RepID=A0A7J8XV62_GOSAI|nr:hypothetical protein [Gossypium aridum]
MEWWTHLWLNEGFATWISYMATDIMFPEWKIWTQFLQEINGGLRLDAQEKSHPIEMKIQHGHEVDEAFDAIGYKKGSAVIRMLQEYIGDEIFQKSLSFYIRRYAWSNARTEDLWSVLSEVTGIQVNSMMDSWTKQKGYPVISVKSKDHILEFEQSQFLLSGFHGDGQWIVPITLCFGSYDRIKSFLLESKSENLDASELFPTSDEKNEDEYGEASWIKVNIGQSGFYRVKYGDELDARLRKAIEKGFLSVTDKYGILDDRYALCVACEQSLSSLLLLMDVYRKESDYIILSKLIDVCYNVLEVLRDAIPELTNTLKEIFINILLCSAKKLGWESTPGESHLTGLMRGEVFMALAAFDHAKTHEQAMHRFQSFLDDRSTELLSPDTKRAAYIAVMRNANASRDGFESLLKVYREADAVQEKEHVLREILIILKSTMASTPSPDILVEVLNFFISKEVRDQDIVYGLPGISLEGHEIAWWWMKENWNFIVNKYNGGLLTHFIRDIISPFCSNEKADEVEEFFESRVTSSFAMNLKQSIEQVRIKARLVETIKQERQPLQDLLKQLIKSRNAWKALSKKNTFVSSFLIICCGAQGKTISNWGIPHSSKESWDLEMDQKQNIEQFKDQPRLRKFSVLKRYDLYLKLDLSDCTFSGLVHINLSIVDPTKFVVLNACELVVHQVLFTNSLNHRFTPCDVALDGDDEILVLLLSFSFSGILDDRYALCAACEQSLASLLSLMDVYKKETDYIVSSELIDVCYNVLEVLRDAISELTNPSKEFFINVLLFSAEKLGWESAPGESHLNALLRGEAAYIAAMGNANRSRDGFQSLLRVKREANAVQEKERVLPEILIILKKQERWNFIVNKYGGGLLTHFNPDIITPVRNNEKGDEVEEFFESRVRPSFAMNLKQCIEQARIKARFVQSIKQERQPLQYLLKQLACKG